jgi:hypothetical protein
MDSYGGQRRIEVEPSGEFMMSSFQEITRENFDAVLFDLDGAHVTQQMLVGRQIAWL